MDQFTGRAAEQTERLFQLLHVRRILLWTELMILMAHGSPYDSTKGNVVVIYSGNVPHNCEKNPNERLESLMILQLLSIVFLTAHRAGDLNLQR